MYYPWEESYYKPVQWSGIPRYSKYFQCTQDMEMFSQCDSFNDSSPRSQSKDVLIECYGRL